MHSSPPRVPSVGGLTRTVTRTADEEAPFARTDEETELRPSSSNGVDRPEGIGPPASFRRRNAGSAQFPGRLF
jgi:hypothetical protein